MKVHDVTPEYQKSLEAAGFKLDVDELIQAKVMDITPEFVEQAQLARIQEPVDRQADPAQERRHSLARYPPQGDLS